LQASPCGLRAYAGQARAGLRAHDHGPPRVFSVGLRAGPTGQALIAIPNYNDYPNTLKFQLVQLFFFYN